MTSAERTRDVRRQDHRVHRSLAILLVFLLGTLVTACTGSAPTPAPFPSAAEENTEQSASPSTPAAEVDVELPVGSSVRKVSVNGLVRTFRVYRPAALADDAPLVVAFHGFGGSAHSSESYYGWNAVADREEFVVLYPEGIDNSFNAGACCGNAMLRGVDDVGATLAMVDDVAGTVAIDPDRMYVTGFSNGGAMAYRMACATDVFAAFGPVSGGQVVQCDDPMPTSILHIHGTADTMVPMSGGADGMGHGPIEENVAHWRSLQQCDPPTDSYAEGIRRSSASCADDQEIDLIVLDGLTHVWPTSFNGVDGAQTLWKFFNRHRR
jgi:polyhydroxybutyrate depolymerase